MRTYVIDDITIQIGAYIVCIRHMGKTIIPKEKRKIGPFTVVKRLVKEAWRNSYFKTRTKAHVAVKVAEISSRCFGFHAAYLLFREECWPLLTPYIPIIMEVAGKIDLTTLVIRLDIGFLLGMVTTWIVSGLKNKLIRGEQHEKTN